MATSKKKRKSSSTTTPAVKRVATPTTPATVAPEPTGDDLVEEYQYVRKDLRQLTFVSAVLFVVMLGVGLFI